MKLLFSLLILSNICNAKVINIYNESNPNKAKVVADIFIQKYGVPKSLISSFQTECTKNVDKRFLNLCINKKGELIQLPSYLKFLKKSLSVFNAQK